MQDDKQLFKWYGNSGVAEQEIHYTVLEKNRGHNWTQIFDMPNDCVQFQQWLNHKEKIK